MGGAAELCALEFTASAGLAGASYRGSFDGWAPVFAGVVLVGALALQIVVLIPGLLRWRRWVGAVGLLGGAGALAFATVGDRGYRTVLAHWLSDREIPMSQLASLETDLGWLAALLLIASAVLVLVRSRWAVPAAFLPGYVVTFVAGLYSWAPRDSQQHPHPARPLLLWTADNVGWAAAAGIALAAWWWAAATSRPLPGLIVAATALLVAWTLASALPGPGYDVISFDAPAFGLFFQAAMGIALLGCFLLWPRWGTAPETRSASSGTGSTAAR